MLWGLMCKIDKGGSSMRERLVILLSLMLIAFGIETAYGALSPLKIMNATTDRVVEILRDKELKKATKTPERRAAIRKAVTEVFDFEEMSKRALSVHWQKLTIEERKEFVSLFSDLLERSYIKKIEGYSDEKIDYLEEKIDGDSALVKSKITTRRNIEIPIDYKLLKRGDKWYVYDVVIEGVSLINNYRTQFNKIIRQSSYTELIKRMKNKQEEELFSEKR
jgi:phospholipid transport system substrate-binding protein